MTNEIVRAEAKKLLAEIKELREDVDCPSDVWSALTCIDDPKIEGLGLDDFHILERALRRVHPYHPEPSIRGVAAALLETEFRLLAQQQQLQRVEEKLEAILRQSPYRSR